MPLYTSTQTCACINTNNINIFLKIQDHLLPETWDSWNSVKTMTANPTLKDLIAPPPIPPNPSGCCRFDWLITYWNRIDRNEMKWSMSPVISALKSGGRSRRILSSKPDWPGIKTTSQNKTRGREEKEQEGRRKQSCRHRGDLALWRNRWSSVRNDHETRWATYKQGQAWLNPSCSLHREPALPISV